MSIGFEDPRVQLHVGDGMFRKWESVLLFLSYSILFMMHGVVNTFNLSVQMSIKCGLWCQSFYFLCFPGLLIHSFVTAVEFLRNAQEGIYDAVIVDSSDPIGMMQ